MQLCTDLDAMPVEDASVVRPEDKSPHVAVSALKWCRALLPAREAVDTAAFKTAARFLMNHRMLEHAPEIPDA